VRTIVFPVEDTAEVLAAVDGAVLDRRFADHAAVPDDHFRAAFEHARDDARGDQDSAEGQSFLQHGRGEEIDEWRVFVRLLQDVEHYNEQDDPEAEPQKCGRHEENSL
jgi:hypothetical protein